MIASKSMYYVTNLTPGIDSPTNTPPTTPHHPIAADAAINAVKGKQLFAADHGVAVQVEFESKL
jgi:hypothetical protein